MYIWLWVWEFLAGIFSLILVFSLFWSKTVQTSYTPIFVMKNSKESSRPPKTPFLPTREGNAPLIICFHFDILIIFSSIQIHHICIPFILPPSPVRGQNPLFPTYMDLGSWYVAIMLQGGLNYLCTPYFWGEKFNGTITAY